jgi:hypothetical protein
MLSIDILGIIEVAMQFCGVEDKEGNVTIRKFYKANAATIGS